MLAIKLFSIVRPSATIKSIGHWMKNKRQIKSNKNRYCYAKRIIINLDTGTHTHTKIHPASRALIVIISVLGNNRIARSRQPTISYSIIIMCGSLQWLSGFVWVSVRVYFISSWLDVCELHCMFMTSSGFSSCIFLHRSSERARSQARSLIANHNSKHFGIFIECITWTERELLQKRPVFSHCPLNTFSSA